MKKKILVTGSQGFIGSWVVDELLNRNYTPIVFDHHKRKSYSDDVEVFLGDVNDEAAVLEAIGHSDGVIHLAAQLGTQETVKNPRPVFQTNLMGGLNVLDASLHYEKPIVNICVGNYFMNNPYSISKNMFERTLDMYVKERGLIGANVRCVNAYGPRQAAAPPFTSGTGVRKIIPAFACRALSGVPVEVYGDGEQVSDCVYVGDVARVLVRSLEEIAGGMILTRTIEVGPSESNTVNEIANMVIRRAALHTGRSVPLEHLPMRPGETPGAVVTVDNTTLTDINISPESLIPVDTGIAWTVDWFGANEGITWSKP